MVLALQPEWTDGGADELPRVRPSRVAVVDVGSATATLALYAGGPGGQVERLHQEGHSLRLMRALGPDRRLAREAIGRTAVALRGFVRRAEAFRAEQILAYATSAVRDAVNQDELVREVRRIAGVDLLVITGEEEGRAAAASAVNTLPVTDGLVVDLGGGSLQVTRLRRRRAIACVSLPLGSLRLSDALVERDPPSAEEISRVRRTAIEALRAVPWLADAGPVIGIGGTIRALAKIHRRAARSPIDHGHGYALTVDDVLDLVDRLSRQRRSERERVPGLAAHRVDTIVAGSVVVASVLRATGAESLLASTWGLREGVAAVALHGPGALKSVREAGLRARFPCVGGAAARARRRVLRAVDDAGVGVAAWIEAAGSDPRRLLDEPLQGHTHAEVLVAARLLGIVPGDAPARLRAALDDALREE